MVSVRRGHGGDRPEEELGEIDGMGAEIAEDAETGILAAKAPRTSSERARRVGGDPLRPEVVHLSEHPCRQQVAGVLHGGCVTVVEADDRADAGALGGTGDLLGLVRKATEGLLTPEMLARRGGGQARRPGEGGSAP